MVASPLRSDTIIIQSDIFVTNIFMKILPISAPKTCLFTVTSTANSPIHFRLFRPVSKQRKRASQQPRVNTRIAEKPVFSKDYRYYINCALTGVLRTPHALFMSTYQKAILKTKTVFIKQEIKKSHD